MFDFSSDNDGNNDEDNNHNGIIKTNTKKDH